MLSIEQCRAARGILAWTQQDLADACGLSKTAINNFEKGHSDIKVDSLRAVKMAFESAGIEFFGQTGLRRKSEDVSILRGPNALYELLVDIYDRVPTMTGDISIISRDNRLVRIMSERKMLENYEALKIYGIQNRILCAEGAKHVRHPNLHYRFLPEALSHGVMSTCIYGDKVALELWETPMIILITSTAARHAEQGRFDYLWSKAE